MIVKELTGSLVFSDHISIRIMVYAKPGASQQGQQKLRRGEGGGGEWFATSFLLLLTFTGHYVLRGGGSEKCCNLQKPLHTSGPLGGVMICSTLWVTIFHILWPFYCHFMAFFGPKWQYLATGSPSNPRLVEHWVNRVEHCSPHPGGSVWAFWTTRKCHWGALEPPKMAFFWLKMAIFGHRQSQRPQIG